MGPASNAGGMKKSRFSTNISLYLGSDTRYGHSYYMERQYKRNTYAVYRMVPFPVTFSDPSNADFKTTSLFDAEYLRNGTR